MYNPYWCDTISMEVILIGNVTNHSVKNLNWHLQKFYAEERLQERFHCKTPLEVRSEALSAETPTQYPIAENKRIEAYKAKWCA